MSPDEFNAFMKRKLLRNLAALLALAPAMAPADPGVSNVRAAQREGTNLVDIYYDLSGGTPPLLVSVEISSDNGASYTVPANSLSGHVGSNVAAGTNRKITWDAGADWADEFSAGMKVKVVATEGGGVTATVLNNINGVDLQTDPNVTLGTRPVAEVGTSLRFGNGTYNNEALFDVDVASAGTFQAGDMITVTVVLDYARPETDHDPSFILTDGTNSLIIWMADNGAGEGLSTVDGNGRLLNLTMPPNGGSSSITLTYSFADTGNVLGASEAGQSDTNSGTTNINAAAGLTFRMRGGGAAEDYQVNTISVSYDVVSATSDL